jgi:hypothetical protein
MQISDSEFELCVETLCMVCYNQRVMKNTGELHDAG